MIWVCASFSYQYYVVGISHGSIREEGCVYSVREEGCAFVYTG